MYLICRSLQENSLTWEFVQNWGGGKKCNNINHIHKAIYLTRLNMSALMNNCDAIDKLSDDSRVYFYHIEIPMVGNRHVIIPDIVEHNNLITYNSLDVPHHNENCLSHQSFTGFFGEN